VRDTNEEDHALSWIVEAHAIKDELQTWSELLPVQNAIVEKFKAQIASQKQDRIFTDATAVALLKDVGDIDSKISLGMKIILDTVAYH
jgi:hypothetical protein